jgi:hypothetical protein
MRVVSARSATRPTLLLYMAMYKHFSEVSHVELDPKASGGPGSAPVKRELERPSLERLRGTVRTVDRQGRRLARSGCNPCSSMPCTCRVPTKKDIARSVARPRELVGVGIRSTTSQ